MTDGAQVPLGRQMRASLGCATGKWWMLPPLKTIFGTWCKPENKLGMLYRFLWRHWSLFKSVHSIQPMLISSCFFFNVIIYCMLNFPFFSITGSNNVHYNGLKSSLTFHVSRYNSTAVWEREGSEDRRGAVWREGRAEGSLEVRESWAKSLETEAEGEAGREGGKEGGSRMCHRPQRLSLPAHIHVSPHRVAN